ncbi:MULTISPECIES: SH3 domain-containing protein [Sinorhizobium]|uniref:Peptide-binding protein n=1 Tax=Sinorhizobium americanum TaxID=194963 RepID=A0A2S3YHE0_9HYPH|nr:MULTISPECIES: SH3 domain-containing protein [Sinorhizobium]PDT40559.1 SH3 domain-containing protein [Sinorhizobium sp. FG01]POH26156.1 peptide-binding protein [Sinorhizobium americanum]
MKSTFLGAAALCALSLMPVVAEAAEGFATANVNMRSGPSTRYPAVTVIPSGESVEIHGCLADRPWCDVSFYGGRGWVAGQYVQALYRSNRVYVEPEYYRPLGIPTVVFEFDRYWDRNYRGRDFYRDRDRWRRGPDWIEEGDWQWRREEERRDRQRRQQAERREWEREQDRRDWERQRTREREQARDRQEARERQQWQRERERERREWRDRGRDEERRENGSAENYQGARKEERARQLRELRRDGEVRTVPKCVFNDFACEND